MGGGIPRAGERRGAGLDRNDGELALPHQPSRWFKSWLFWFGAFWFLALGLFWAWSRYLEVSALGFIDGYIWMAGTSQMSVIVSTGGPFDGAGTGDWAFYLEPAGEPDEEPVDPSPPVWVDLDGESYLSREWIIGVRIWVLLLVYLAGWLLVAWWWQRRKWRRYRQALPLGD